MLPLLPPSVFMTLSLLTGLKKKKREKFPFQRSLNVPQFTICRRTAAGQEHKGRTRHLCTVLILLITVPAHGWVSRSRAAIFAEPYQSVNATPRAKWAGGRHKEIKRGRAQCGRGGNASQRGYPSQHRAALAFPVSSKFAAVSGPPDPKEGQRPPTALISPRFPALGTSQENLRDTFFGATKTWCNKLTHSSHIYSSGAVI